MDYKAYHEKYRAELFDYVLPFWQNNSPDTVNGGIYNCLDSDGKVFSTDKSVWAQGRCAWIFSYLCDVYGNKNEWLVIAKSCIDFLNAYCIDKSDDRMYFTVTGDGKPLRKRRYFFSETFYIIGNAQYYKVSGDTTALENAIKYYDFVWDIYKDSTKDPYKITPKSIAETRNTIPLANSMILLNVSSVMRRCDPSNTSKYNSRIKEIIDAILTKFMKPELKALLESVGVDGAFMSEFSAGRVINPGHSIEAAWFLLDEAVYLNDSKLIEHAENIFNWSFDLGWDYEFGGLLYYTDILGKPPEQYEHDMKLWWPHCEALIAALILYKTTKKEEYLEKFKLIDEYAFKYLSDHQSGDWYGYLHRDGSPTLPACKGSTYKSGFHLLRALVMVERMLSE